MPADPHNQVRARREARGLSQVALAAAAALTRQSVGAIEAGRAVPAVDVALRLATALCCTVEDLFGQAGGDPSMTVQWCGAEQPGRVALAQVGTRWMSYPLSGAATGVSADGIAAPSGRSPASVSLLRAESALRENLVVMGCATALGLLADRLNSRPGPGRFLWMPASSTRALEALAAGHAHVAGLHLVDDRSGVANLADARRFGGPDLWELITLARWEEGLLLARGNPRRIRSSRDIARRGVRLITRERGSGARRLLDRELRAAGLLRVVAARRPIVATGHREVAQAIALGAADVGMGTRDVAIAFGLDFLPLADERYDLAIPRTSLDDPRVRRLLDVMTSLAARRELESLGYDVRPCGDRVDSVSAS